MDGVIWSSTVQVPLFSEFKQVEATVYIVHYYVQSLYTFNKIGRVQFAKQSEFVESPTPGYTEKTRVNEGLSGAQRLVSPYSNQGL